jgi:hypothetical protein
MMGARRRSVRRASVVIGGGGQRVVGSRAGWRLRGRGSFMESIGKARWDLRTAAAGWAGVVSWN